MVPIAGRARYHSLNLKKSNFNLCSSFLCLQGQFELCGTSPVLLFLSISMANLSHLVAASFSSLALLSSSVSTANRVSFESTRRCFSWSSVSDNHFFSSCPIFFASYPQPFCSSVSEVLLALSFPFLSERFFFIHAKAA